MSVSREVKILVFISSDIPSLISAVKIYSHFNNKLSTSRGYLDYENVVFQTECFDQREMNLHRDIIAFIVRQHAKCYRLRVPAKQITVSMIPDVYLLESVVKVRGPGGAQPPAPV